LYKDKSNRRKVWITYKSPVSIKQEKLKRRVPNGKVCFIITSHYHIWFKKYMKLVVTLVVAIHLATKIEILYLKIHNTEHC